MEVIATSGDAHLGGDDFDEVIVRWVLTQIETEDEVMSRKIRGNPIAISRIREAASTAKCQLSKSNSAVIDIPLLYQDYSINYELSRYKFNALCKGLITRLLKPVREAAIMAGVNLPGESGQIGMQAVFDNDEETVIENSVADSEIKTTELVDYNNLTDEYLAALKLEQNNAKSQNRMKRKVKGTVGKEVRRLQKELKDSTLSAFPSGLALDDVIMVGGATRIPAVVRLVKVITGITPRRTVNPDEAVCIGAGIQAGILDGEIKDMQVMSAWQAEIYRTLYAEKMKQNNIFGVEIDGSNGNSNGGDVEKFLNTKSKRQRDSLDDEEEAKTAELFDTSVGTSTDEHNHSADVKESNTKLCSKAKEQAMNEFIPKTDSAEIRRKISTKKSIFKSFRKNS